MLDRIESQNIKIGKYVATHNDAIINFYYTPIVLTTNSLIFEKDKKQNDKINFLVAEEMGHDHRGYPIYKWDKEKNIADVTWDTIRVNLHTRNRENSAVYFHNKKQEIADSSLVKKAWNIFNNDSFITH